MPKFSTRIAIITYEEHELLADDIDTAIAEASHKHPNQRHEIICNEEMTLLTQCICCGYTDEYNHAIDCEDQACAMASYHLLPGRVYVQTWRGQIVPDGWDSNSQCANCRDEDDRAERRRREYQQSWYY
jgi:hypothetical protein